MTHHEHPQQTHFRETASQTCGPYVHIGLAQHQAGFQVFEKTIGNVLAQPATRGERIRIEGRIFDGTGTIVRDAFVELWQANAQGRYAHPGDEQAGKEEDPTFRGWGRAGADFDTGVWTFDTVKPGSVAGRGDSVQAPHLNLWIVARGINIGLATRMYFDDEAEANGRDPVLNGIEWEVRRSTLLGRREVRDGHVVYRFDIRLQDTPDGGRETIFFDI